MASDGSDPIGEIADSDFANALTEIATLAFISTQTPRKQVRGRRTSTNELDSVQKRVNSDLHRLLSSPYALISARDRPLAPDTIGLLHTLLDVIRDLGSLDSSSGEPEVDSKREELKIAMQNVVVALDPKRVFEEDTEDSPEPSTEPQKARRSERLAAKTSVQYDEESYGNELAELLGDSGALDDDEDDEDEGETSDMDLDS